MSAYRTTDCPLKTITPEDEMRIILTRSEEPALKRAIVIRVALLAFIALAAVRGEDGWQFYALFDAVLLAVFVWQLTKRARMRKRLAQEGYEVRDV